MEKRKTNVDVKCEFTEDGDCAKDLILQAFLAFLYRNFSNKQIFDGTARI